MVMVRTVVGIRAGVDIRVAGVGIPGGVVDRVVGVVRLVGVLLPLRHRRRAKGKQLPNNVKASRFIVHWFVAALRGRLFFGGIQGGSIVGKNQLQAIVKRV